VSAELERVEGLREPQRLSHQLSTRLAAEIVSGRIAVGDAFPSSEEIVSRFGVSRTVAREMVQTLSMLGMVSIRHGKRTEVCPEEDWDILSSVVQEALRREGKAAPILHDLYEFRLLIEPQAAGWMAELGKDSELAELGAIATQMEELAAAGTSMPELMEADRGFHRLIARASGNRVLAAVGRDIREVIATLWDLSSLQPAHAPHVAEQHRRIADTVRQRDTSGAIAAMHDHLVWAAGADLRGLDSPADVGLARTAATG
jgi:DNA-binding FadR family transcriptional regulator